ncbi:MAG TPA: hypothetical protein VEJ46_05605 [Candidatus Acidoferrum sp.]|nr:hypothetical protein [Candidatus Acidoferrum sp.]
MSSSASSPTISIDVSKDLTSASALQSMLTSQKGAIFQILGELGKYATQPVKEAASSKASAAVSLTETASWTTSNGIGFSLTPTAKCSVSIATVSETFPVAMNIESTDPKNTQNVSAGPTPGIVYVNIDLDFSITGSVSGSGTFGGVGIAGKASGSEAATLSFCQPVSDSLNTLDAVRMAFEQLIFPLDPACTENMQTGTLAKVAFDGAINCELDVTYGLGNYKVSAPDLTSVQQSLANVVQLKSPSVEVNVGIKGSITYSHADHFALIINKTKDTTAMLYLVRSSQNDAGVSIGITAGITTTAASVTIDQSKLQSLAQDVTGSSAIASQVASAVSQPLNSLQNGLNGKLKNWASDVSGSVGLSFGLSRQKGHAALFVFQVDLTKADLAKESWAALVGGSVTRALLLQGFTLQPGSGVADSLKRASNIQFQFFNFFSFQQVTDYFSNGYTELGKDGTIRIFRDLGQEQQSATKRAMQVFRIYFEATATQAASGGISQSSVDLCVELSETGKSKYAAALANVAGFLPGSAAVNSAQERMVTFVAAKPTGTLDLKMTFKSSAYQKLSCSPYSGNTPPPKPQQQDHDNWNAFQSATEILDPDVNFAGNLNYAAWMIFNLDSWDQVGSTKTPDRRQFGNWSAVPPSFLQHYGPPALVAYFLQASQGFMNLCDQLKTLAAGVANVQSSKEWSDMLNFLTDIVTKDVYIDYAKPIAAALLELCSEGGAQVSSALNEAPDSNSLTCALTIA